MQSQNPVINAPDQSVAQPPAIEQIASAVIATAAAPTAENVVADIETALNLFVEFKNALGGLHPSALNIVKTSLSLLL